jgi:hypothetical protein
MEERTYKFSITNFNFEPQFEYNGQS